MDILVLIAAIAFSILVFTILIKIVWATISTAIAIAFILFLLQIAFGIGPLLVIVRPVGRWLAGVWELLTGS